MKRLSMADFGMEFRSSSPRSPKDRAITTTTKSIKLIPPVKAFVSTRSCERQSSISRIVTSLASSTSLCKDWKGKLPERTILVIAKTH